MRFQIIRFLLVALCVLSLATVLPGQSSVFPVRAETALVPENLAFTPITTGLTQPVFITHAGDGSGRLFIVERAGQIRIVKNGSLLSTPFLDIDPIVNSSSGERGLLALAFHPKYAGNGQFYTVHTASDGSLVLSSFTRSTGSPDLADASSRQTLLSIPHPDFGNHNGGTLAFGPDGFLYWSTGDGGGSGDPGNNAQDLSDLLGKMLRLDVDSASPYAIPASNPFFNDPDPSIREEIWAYGLRNPWKFSFDPQTGDLYLGDVGQGEREEIDFQPASSTGGENYGWRLMEGTRCFNPSSGCNPGGLVLPIAEYDHSVGCSVTGGYVYRGSLFPLLRGHYFYGDFCTGAFFSLEGSPSGGWAVTPLGDTPYSISTFGEDENGELYLADYGTGAIYQLGYVTFADVPLTHGFHRYIEALFDAGITGGCSASPRRFCPDNSVTRAQMSVFLLRGKYGGTYAPPPVGTTTGFSDVATNYWAAAWIKQLAAEGITGGCASGRFCPDAPVTREQMAIFLLKAKYGKAYAPPAVGTTTGFNDVPTTHWAAAWIKQLALEKITGGCGAGNYCPDQPVTRGQMAVFLVRTFGIPLP